MAEVWIPATIQSLTGGKSKVTVEGATLREVVNNLEKAYPGIKEKLLDGATVREHFTVFIDGGDTSGSLLEPVEENSEVHFLPAISGGC